MKKPIDSLGDRMKLYERIEGDRYCMPLLPILARIDGRSFHSFTKGMQRPYDLRLSRAMIETTRKLVIETNALVGYTQSDEITLLWKQPSLDSQLFFNGRIAKIVSQLGALSTLHFYREIARTMPEYAERLPTFDARIWQVPNETEAANVFVWREWDATKNSITMAASSHYCHHELQGMNGPQKQEMLFQKGINWNDYPTFFKRGTYIQKLITTRPFKPEELNALPPKHAVRFNPHLLVCRTEYVEANLPIITTISNREAVLFRGAIPSIINTTNEQNNT